MSSVLSLQKVDFDNEEQVKQLVALLQMYAKDPMGGGQEIPDTVITTLPDELRKRPYMHSFILFEDEKALAFANCIESFSTFTGNGLMNIHDFAVVPSERGKGLSQFLLKGIEEYALALGCTKLTLEVLEGNTAAIKAYKYAGFSAYQLDPEMGNAMFWQKSISQ